MSNLGFVLVIVTQVVTAIYEGLSSCDPTYQKLQHDCPYDDAYTQVDGTCNGWEGISLDACLSKCKNNEVPDGCGSSLDDKICQYIRYSGCLFIRISCIFQLNWENKKKVTPCQSIVKEPVKTLLLESADVFKIERRT